MRALHEQNHYEVLEVSPGAAPEEIERAYRIARETYDADSLALYSVFGARDAAVIRERLDEAYRVLSDRETRRAYDLSEVVEGADQALDREAPGARAAGLRAAERTTRRGEELRAVGETFRDLETDVEEAAGDFDGAKLRRARLRRGIELDQVADITKVSIANLRHIEEEEFESLPATVYVRGFVTSYARAIGLDPQRVVASYVARVEHVRGDQGRGRFLGRR